MKVAVLQSNYIPWKGYFDIIHDVDLFIFHDDLQFTKADWRNRNLIKTPQGPQWLTIPVGSRDDRLICDVELPPSGWSAKHWRVLQQHYAKAPYFSRYEPLCAEIYAQQRWTTLSEFNQFVISTVTRDCLGVETSFDDSRRFHLKGQKGERLLELLIAAGATTYVSGPAAKSYIDEALFGRSGIRVVWKDYSGYPEYEQCFPPFSHQVSILDLLFHVGPAAPWHIWGWRLESTPTALASKP
jgi:hypothetical protein